jgi:hypothetical protein
VSNVIVVERNVMSKTIVMYGRKLLRKRKELQIDCWSECGYG